MTTPSKMDSTMYFHGRWVPLLLSVMVFGSVVCRAEGESSAPSQRSGDRWLMAYKESLRSQFGAKVAVPRGGVTWSWDSATLTLESGKVRLMKPMPGGAVTGLVFEGEGRFQMQIPDPAELRYLRRILKDDSLERFEQSFHRLVLRTSEDFLPKIWPEAQGPYTESKMAAKRRDNWLERVWFDVDARVLSGLLAPGDEYIRAEMKTSEHGWVCYEFDRRRQEEITLERVYDETSDTWVSLDRTEQRRKSGRPGSRAPQFMDIRNAHIEASFKSGVWSEKVGRAQTKQSKGTFKVRLDFVPLVEGWSALPLVLSAEAEVKAVLDGDGRSLPFIRNHIGGGSSFIDDQYYDDSLLVLLDAPLAKGNLASLMVEYEMKVSGYASGRRWYPGHAYDMDDPLTAELRFTLSKGQEIKVAGVPENETVEKGKRISSWKVERPVRMIGFTFGPGFREKEVEIENSPKVVAFGADTRVGWGDIVFNVAADVANSQAFFQSLFDLELPYSTIYATSIPAGHGQAFDGFLHLSEWTFYNESSGASELFRAHEVAHQIWGHAVSWQSYRDQWLSESFAEYSAMMFIEANPKLEKFFPRILDAYTSAVFGSLKSAFGKFARPDLAIETMRRGHQVAPIGFGRRASTKELPSGYMLQAYVKGPLVLHMLRSLLRRKSGGDRVFIEILRDFVSTFKGKAASTLDFQRIVEKHTRARWGWFFHQWLERAEIPTYRWKYKARRSKDRTYVLNLEVEQSGVTEGFMMPVPVRVEFGKGKVKEFLLPIKQPKETFKVPLQAKPKRVIFNPDHAVLARVEKL